MSGEPPGSPDPSTGPLRGPVLRRRRGGRGGRGGRRCRGHGRLLLLDRLRLRLRPDENQLGLAPVRRVPSVVVEQLLVLINATELPGRARWLAAFAYDGPSF